jgi:predicted nucleic acid-binding protein
MTIKEICETSTIDGLCVIANRALKKSRRAVIAMDEARAVVLACERRAGELAA